MKRNIVIGAAWTYANSDIHLGHICAYMGGDVLARYHRAKGDNVCFVSGTDCHGTPTTERAIRENTTPEKIVGKYHQQYCEVFEALGMSYDLYTMTADPYHHRSAQEMFLQLHKNGYIYPKTEDASFCPKCGKFVYDREVEVICPKCGEISKGDQCGKCDYVFTNQDLLHAKCRICGSPTEVKSNTNLYLKLSTLEAELNQHFERCKSNWRKNTVQETQKFLKEGLMDRAVTRDLNWGIPIPMEGYDDKRIYVWVEAVWGYVSATQRYCEENGLDWRDFWFDQGEGRNKMYMCHGKDNIVFHTIIFPALLLATDKRFHLPDHCVSIEFLNAKGEKMSKSKGNGLTMVNMLGKYNPDGIRYFCIANGPEHKDVDFSPEIYAALFNGEVVNKYGNLVNRVVNYKGLDGYIPHSTLDPVIVQAVSDTFRNAGNSLEKADFRDAISSVMLLVDLANKYFDSKQPWVLYKNEDKSEFYNVLYNCAYIVANLGVLMQPFMPFSAAKIRECFGLDNYDWQPVKFDGDLHLNAISQLFERVKVEDLTA